MKNVCLVATLLAAAGAAAQGRLPPCPGAYAANKWSNCYGANMTNTGNTYAGEWLNDKFEGQGTYRYRDGSKYVGQFSNNRRNGQGTFTWRDGASYVGGYKDDMRAGKGTFTFPNGAKYVGEYRDDKRNGPGIEYRADGSVLQSGNWKNDVFETSR
jgi:hypothetical protein